MRKEKKRRVDESPVAPYTCHKCGYRHDTIWRPDEEARPASPGMALICLNCAAVNIYLGESERVVRAPTLDEMTALFSTDKFIVMIEAARRVVEARRSSRDLGLG